MKTRLKTRSCILIALALVVSVSTSRVSAQSTDVTQLEVGGYVLRLGMTTEQLTQGIGKAFETEFNAGPSSFMFKQNDVNIARVFVKNGKVIEIDKLLRFKTRKEAVAIVEEFFALRRTTVCRLQLDEQNPTDETKLTGIMITHTACGNVLFSSFLYFYSDNDTYTAFQLSIFSR